LLREPESLDVRQLASACHDVYAWADAKGLKHTAVHFAEAAAYADPRDAARANFAARTSRRVLFKQRAALWYARAHKLAVASRNQREAVYALLGYGTMMKDAGNFEEARKAFERGARRATSTHRRREAAEAYHDLLALALEQRRLARAELYARKALWLYPVRHARFPALAYDVAFLLVLRGHYTAAAGVLDQAAPAIARLDERALVLSALAWAAGGAGWNTRRTEAEEAALKLVEAHSDYAPAVFVHLADACRTVREWDRAEEYACRAQAWAIEREEPRLSQIATTLRSAIERREPHPPEVPEGDASAAMVRSIFIRFAKWRSPSPKRSARRPPHL
jgi:tetratricopeptide (TPR) repeat protein